MYVHTHTRTHRTDRPTDPPTPELLEGWRGALSCVCIWLSDVTNTLLSLLPFYLSYPYIPEARDSRLAEPIVRPFACQLISSMKRSAKKLAKVQRSIFFFFNKTRKKKQFNLKCFQLGQKTEPVEAGFFFAWNEYHAGRVCPKVHWSPHLPMSADEIMPCTVHPSITIPFLSSSLLFHRHVIVVALFFVPGSWSTFSF